VAVDIYQGRPDLVGFIKGLPLVVYEFKTVTERIESTFKDNITGLQVHDPGPFLV
jgi:type I site-specific restriction-modification system R (restriction) subunit